LPPLDTAIVPPLFAAPVPLIASAVMVRGENTSVAAVAIKVFAPFAVPSVQLPTVAVPFASVVCVAPVIVPPPLATANVTPMPDTGFENASTMRTPGATATALPALAV
jgi:hypothetical protein